MNAGPGGHGVKAGHDAEGKDDKKGAAMAPFFLTPRCNLVANRIAKCGAPGQN